MDERRPEPAIRTVEEVPASRVGRADGATIRVVLGPKEGVPGFVMREFTIEPGGSIPAHRHDRIEHEQLVLEGEMVLGLDDREVVVRAGQAVFIPAGVVHWYENRGEVPVRFLCVVPRTDDYRTEWVERPAPGR